MDFFFLWSAEPGIRLSTVPSILVHTGSYIGGHN